MQVEQRTQAGPSPASAPGASRQIMARQLAALRQRSLDLTAHLSVEDQCVQSMPDASPTKWHLAHTTWFFETLVLAAFQPGWTDVDAGYAYLFNSYYNALGPRHPRPQRGLLTRPSLAQVLAYRARVDQALVAFVAGCDEATWTSARPMLVLGMQHEQQHQELLLTDLLHLFSGHPGLPAYTDSQAPGLRPACHPPSQAAALADDGPWLQHAGGVLLFGHAADVPEAGFAYDNESPRHPRLLPAFQIARALVTQGEYLQFVQDAAYQRPELWFSDGWAMVQAQGWTMPAYWLAPDDGRNALGRWAVFGPDGVQPLDPHAAVTHLSWYEAAAYAEWAGARLPTEFEWEAAAGLPGLQQVADTAWQWTRSAYEPYPGFQPWAGAVGEYNGKFMVGQMVLRGGSWATPPGHARYSYRNFFPPAARWQVTGLRLARDGAP